MTYLEMWDKGIIDAWIEFVRCNGIYYRYSPKEFIEEMKSDSSRILSTLQSGILSTPTIINILTGGATNYFIVNDFSYRGICKKCGANGIVLLIMDEHYTENLDKKVFIPRIENYCSLFINPDSNLFKCIFPIPINHETDYWYCPNCQELHRFIYDKDLGLIFVQEAVYNTVLY